MERKKTSNAPAAPTFADAGAHPLMLLQKPWCHRFCVDGIFFTDLLSPKDRTVSTKNMLVINSVLL
jgi:hypothetical protein